MVDPSHLLRRWRPPLAVALLIGALLLLGCGSDGNSDTTAAKSDPTTAEAPTAGSQKQDREPHGDATDGHGMRHGEKSDDGKAGNRPKKTKKKVAVPPSNEKADDQAATNPHKDAKSGAGTAKNAPDGAKSGAGTAKNPQQHQSPSGCPGGLSARQCKSAAESIETSLPQSGGGEDEPRCPAGVSEADCKAVAKAVESASESAPVPDGEGCPPVLSAAQCQAAGEAIAR